MSMFDKIATDWHHKRKKPWGPFVQKFKQSVRIWWEKFSCEKKRKIGGLLFIDLGSGSGRHNPILRKYCGRLIEIEQSRKMLENNPYRSIKIQADMTALPLRENVSDGIISVAAIHHVKRKENRKGLIENIKKIGRNHCFVALTVWRFYQKKFYDQYIEQLKKCPPYPEDFEVGNVYVPWTISRRKKGKNGKKEKITVQRFYHLFRAAEFRKLLRPIYNIKFSTMKKRLDKSGKNKSSHKNKSSDEKNGLKMGKSTSKKNRKKKKPTPNFFFAGYLEK